MSADRWTKCPKCQQLASLREDWDIGIENGLFEVRAEVGRLKGHRP